MNRFLYQLAQVVHCMGQRYETVNFGDQEVKVQGHAAPKIDLEACSLVAFLVKPTI